MKYLVPLACLAVVFFAEAASAQGKKSADVVKIASSADKPGADGNQTVTIVLDIEKPWHLYANPVGNESLTTVQTLVKFPGKEAKITYPAGKTVKDKIAGDYITYEGKVTIKAQVKRGADDKGPLEFTIKIQACNKDSCLAPATVKKSVE